MAKKAIEYNFAKSYLKDKDRYIVSFADTFLDKMQACFVYDGLPETIPCEELEKLLQENGQCFVTEVEGKLYALSGTAGGEGDAYNRPTLYTVANAWLNLSKTYEIGKDGVLCKNDFKCMGLLPIILKSGAKMCDLEITVNTLSILHRVCYMISAPDDKTKASAELFMKHIEDGDFSIIADNAFFDGVKLQSPPTGNGTFITQYIELMQYEKATLLNELGLNANFNMKRERLNDGEIALNIDAILPFIDNMYNERKKFVESINAMFGTEITVDMGSAWKTLHEEKEKETAEANTDLDVIDSQQPSLDVSQGGTDEEEQEQVNNEDEPTEDGDEPTEDERKKEDEDS